MTNWLYSDIVKDHFTNPRNFLSEDESFSENARGETGNIKCGDKMIMLLQIKDDIISEIRWKTYGCASAIASTSMLSETIKGMNIADAYKIKPEDLVKKLGGLPQNKIHCSVLGDKALRAAIDDYLTKTGRAGLFTEESVIICNCLDISAKDLEDAWKNGCRSWEDLQSATKIGTVCGNCKTKAMEQLDLFEHMYS